jgi:hypothetical protein
MADRALTQQFADDRTTERPGASGHDNVPAFKCFRHPGPLLLFF